MRLFTYANESVIDPEGNPFDQVLQLGRWVQGTRGESERARITHSKVHPLETGK